MSSRSTANGAPPFTPEQQPDLFGAMGRYQAN